MSDFYPFLVAGLVSGAVYGLTATGLVLTYKTSGIFNFAHGGLAAAGAYLFFQLREEWDLPWPLAFVLVVLVAAPLVGLLLEQLADWLNGASVAAKVVATIGLLTALQGLLTAIYGAAVRNARAFLPTDVHSLGSVNVGEDQMLVFAIAVATTVALSLYLRRSRMGTAMRGVVDDPALLDLAGTSPVRVRRVAWAIGSSFAALSGVLLAPTIGLDPVLLTLLAVQAFGAAAIGGFSSLPLTLVGGLVLGVGSAVSTKYVVDVPVLSGLPPSLPFIALFVVLVLTRRGRFVELGTVVARRHLAQRRGTGRPVRLIGGTGLVVLLVLVPWLVDSRLPVYTTAVVYVLVFASLRLLVATSGQVSLCHVAFAAVGATTFAHLTHGVGLPWGVALFLTGLLTVPIGAIVAIPAIRLSGLYLALATFGFGILVERLLYPMGLMFGADGFAVAPRPDFGPIDGASDRTYYLVCLAIVLAGVLCLHLVDRSRLGRLLRGMADSPLALSTLGVGVTVTRVIVFCVSAFFAGIAGGLFASFSGTTSGISFNAFQSLSLVVVLAIAGRGKLVAPVVAAAALYVVPSHIGSATFDDYLPVLFGVSAIAVSVMTNEANGLLDGLRVAIGRAAQPRSASRLTIRAGREVPAGEGVA
jgi:branched-subunit amino acid ABC-type transport system permease component